MRKIALILVLMAMVALTGCGGGGGKKFAPPPKPQPYHIEILSHESKCEWWEYGEEWITTITGEAKNNSGQTCSPWLRAYLYNYDDVMVGTAYDFLWDMPAGETWKFELSYYGEKIKKYKLSVYRVTT